ncbi:MAG: hypothetical protein IT282_07925 [Bacteroidetes bacterium]|nr:hypothetical protein [Bacteroidota bacterium]
MKTRQLRTERIAVTYGNNPLSIGEIRLRETGQSIARNARQSFLIRTPERISDPTFLTEVVAFEIADGSMRARLEDPTGAYSIELVCAPGVCGMVFTMTARAPVPIWMVEWKLTGLDFEEVILPALGGQALKRTMPPETTLSYKYPFWWNAQFLIGVGSGGGVLISTRDAEPKFKLVRVRREQDRFGLSLGFEADGPLGAKDLTAEWSLDGYAGSWKAAAERHREWMEKAFALTPLPSHPSNPPWAGEINFVLELWGMAKDRPTPLHTFKQMEGRIKAFSRMHDPHATLLYLPGYAEHGIDSRAPSYAPSPHLGGESGFASLVALAHGLGYRVMIHTNVLCMTFDHPLFSQFREHQVVDVFGRAQGWGLDIDGDWLPEPYFAYINPGVKAWGDVIEGVLADLIRKFGIDGVFLDQTLLAFNLQRGPNFQTGMREHILRLQRAFPGILFAGEGFHELVAAALPMAQIHGIDSIAEVHGMEGRAKWRVPHPVSAHVFGRYTRFTAHLLTRHPSHPLFAMQEGAYARLGVIPALCLYNNTQPLDTPATRRMIRRATTL